MFGARITLTRHDMMLGNDVSLIINNPRSTYIYNNITILLITNIDVKMALNVESMPQNVASGYLQQKLTIINLDRGAQGDVAMLIVLNLVLISDV